MIFFGTSSFSIIVLDRLLEHGIKPTHIVTVPDKPSGRKLVMTPPPLKVWAEERGIPCLQFAKLNDEAVEALSALSPELFIVASYGKIIPKKVLDIPAKGALNVHPSLLPKYRGAAPLQTSILNDDRETGVCIIQMDELMDHGPIVAKKAVEILPWPPSMTEIEKILGEAGADILAKCIPHFLNGTAELEEQNHDLATFTKKIEKEDGHIELDPSSLETGVISGKAGYDAYLKYQALEQWPGIFFFINKHGADMRVKVKGASWNEGASELSLLSLVPEGKKEMGWKDFANFLKN